MYTKESLTKINGGYNCDHCVNESDVTKANTYVDLIESSRTKDTPRSGDILQLTTKHGDYYKFAHIEKVDNDGLLNVCEQAYTPFIGVNDNKDGIYCSTSGGAWCAVPLKDVKYIGKEKKTFCDWGSCGACGNGAIDFEAEVSVWEYIEPNSLYDNYSTKDYQKQNIFYVEELKDGSSYHYKGDSIAFENKIDYLSWLNTYKGVEFKGHWDNQTIVFCYKKSSHYIDKNEWDALDLPKDIRTCNGRIRIKFEYDDKNHIVHEYRYTNDGSKLDWSTNLPYEVQRKKLEELI